MPRSIARRGGRCLRIDWQLIADGDTSQGADHPDFILSSDQDAAGLDAGRVPKVGDKGFVGQDRLGPTESIRLDNNTTKARP